jgi:hypothetical protein
MRVIYLIALILGIAYTGLTLYFEWRLEKKEKEWQRKLKHTQNLKKN